MVSMDRDRPLEPKQENFASIAFPLSKGVVSAFELKILEDSSPEGWTSVLSVIAQSCEVSASIRDVLENSHRFVCRDMLREVVSISVSGVTKKNAKMLLQMTQDPDVGICGQPGFLAFESSGEGRWIVKGWSRSDGRDRGMEPTIVAEIRSQLSS